MTRRAQSTSTSAPARAADRDTAVAIRSSPPTTPGGHSGGPSARPVSAMSPDVAVARSSAALSSSPGVRTTRGYAARITTTSPGVLSASAASELLAAVRAGTSEVLGVLDDTPLLAVDLGAGDDLAEPAPAWLPCVVVGMAASPPAGPAPAGVDVALCPGEAGGAPAGWVAGHDVDGELAHLRAQVRRSPQASVLLAQLLRAGAGLDLDRGLVAESLAYSTLQAGPVFAAWLEQRRRAAPKVRTEADNAVLVERRSDTLVLTLNRPEVRNAVDTRLRDALADALALACADSSIGAVELRGAGPDFSSGGDLDAFGTLPDAVTAHVTRTVRSPARLLGVVGERVTAYVHGACVGAGIELAAFARTVVASFDTRIHLPEVSLGLVPGAGGTVSIPRRIGAQRTAWLGLGGAVLDATTAAHWGLVDEVDASS
jgi:enoyl-CoA hydratase/carnithine racemase